jgi:arsenite/tail-anchored protein-transporting ATPase
VGPALTRLPPVTFVGGKGGVGKTTYSAIAALGPGPSGHSESKALLVTTDPASSLPDIFGKRVGPAPTRIAPGLHAASLDAARAFARWLEPRRPLLADIGLRGTYLDDEDIARLLKLSLPGIDEIIGLLESVRLARDFDRVIVDTAPTGHTLRLLAAPALLTRVAATLDVLQSHHRLVISALRGSYVEDAADALIQELDRDGRMLAGLLRDRASTTIDWVTLPEPMALEETMDAIAALDRDGIPVTHLIVNRVARAGRGEWCEARRRFEARACAPVAGRFPGREILALPDLGEEPRGLAALRKAAKLIARFERPRATPPIEKRVRANLAGLPPERGSCISVFGDAQWLLFGGKGGVGKTTCAAAAALRLAETRRVLLLSADPAHSLGDVFGARLDDRPRAVPDGPPTLHVREIDAAAAFAGFRQSYEEAVDETFARIARAANAGQSAFRDLIGLAPPGIDEVIAVAEVASALNGARREYDVVVTDTAPTGHALRLLHTPAILRDWTQALMTILRKYRELVGAGTLAELLVRLSRRLRGLQEILSDAARTRFMIVTRAAVLPVEEALDLMKALTALNVPVGGVIVNALGAATCAPASKGPGGERAQLERLGRAAARRHRCVIIGTPAEMPPPHGAAALADWGSAWRQLA